jgi:hypothetical protein
MEIDAKHREMVAAARLPLAAKAFISHHLHQRLTGTGYGSASAPFV